MGVDPLLEMSAFIGVEPATTDLIGVGRVGEAVGDDPLSGRQRGLDAHRQMLAPGGEHQQRLGFEVHGVVQQQHAQFFPQRRAAGLASLHNLTPVAAQPGAGTGNLGALAGAVDTFKADQTAARVRDFHESPLRRVS